MARASSYPLRVPEDLRAKLEEEATKNGRSYNSELNIRLQASLDLQAEIGVDFEHVIHVIVGLNNDSKRMISVDIENAQLREKLKSLQNEFTRSFAISGGDKAELAVKKLKKAYAHISSGLEEIGGLLPEEK